MASSSSTDNELLPTTDELMQYRAISQILQIFDKANAEKGFKFRGTKLGSIINETKSQRPRDVIMYQILTALVNVLVRGVEIVAAIPAYGPQLNINAEIHEETILDKSKESRLLITRNPGRAEQFSRSVELEALSIGDDSPSYQVNVNGKSLNLANFSPMDDNLDITI